MIVLSRKPKRIMTLIILQNSMRIRVGGEEIGKHRMMIIVRVERGVVIGERQKR